MIHRIVIWGALAVLLSSTVACTDREDLREVPASEESLESVPPAGDAPSVEDGEGRLDVVEVEVILTDFVVEMPDSLPAAWTRFVIRNEGEVAHDFAVQGPGVDARLPTSLRPGEELSLEVDLSAGTYQVTCPLKDHAERGMRRELTVGEADVPAPAEAESGPE